MSVCFGIGSMAAGWLHFTAGSEVQSAIQFIFRSVAKPQSSSGNKGGTNSLFPEQKWVDGDMHARRVGDIFSEHMST